MDLIFVQTAVDQSDEDLIAGIRAIREHSQRHPCWVVLIVHGYDDDPREQWEIAEVRAHLRRLVDFGFIAILARSTGIHGLAPESLIGCPGLGGFEVRVHGHELVQAGDNAIPEALVQTFAGTILPAAEESLRRNLLRFPHVPANPRLLLEFGGQTS
jgi:hypothetical protein